MVGNRETTTECERRGKAISTIVEDVWVGLALPTSTESPSSSSSSPESCNPPICFFESTSGSTRVPSLQDVDPRLPVDLPTSNPKRSRSRLRWTRRFGLSQMSYHSDLSNRLCHPTLKKNSFTYYNDDNRCCCSSHHLTLLPVLIRGKT